MDPLPFRCFILFSVVIFFKGVSSFSLSASKSADKAILGNNPFNMSCQYAIQPNEQLFVIELQRKRGTSVYFDTIVSYPSPSISINVSYQDTSLESRTIATKPTEQSRTASLQFNTVECDDKATYRWKAHYTDGSNKYAMATVSVIVRANTLYAQHMALTFTPSENIEEDDNVRFQCTGDVGNEPIGQLGWFYYLDNATSVPINVSAMAVSQAPEFRPKTCSYRRTSTLQLKMIRSFNNIIVRCTVQQDHFDQFGEVYWQTWNIPVHSRTFFTTMTAAKTARETVTSPSLYSIMTSPGTSSTNTLTVICSTIDKVRCAQDIEPVCGSDDRTYINYCEFHKEICQQHGLKVKHIGFC